MAAIFLDLCENGAVYLLDFLLGKTPDTDYFLRVSFVSV